MQVCADRTGDQEARWDTSLVVGLMFYWFRGMSASVDAWCLLSTYSIARLAASSQRTAGSACIILLHLPPRPSLLFFLCVCACVSSWIVFQSTEFPFHFIS
jgi:hypothetical protein